MTSDFPETPGIRILLMGLALLACLTLAHWAVTPVAVLQEVRAAEPGAPDVEREGQR